MAGTIANSRISGGEMSEQPILFKGEMVRAALEGRKTQTRRIAWEFDIHHKIRKSQKDAPVEWAGAVHPARDSGWVSWYPGDTRGLADLTKKNYAKGIECPYGRVGDRLWCRETWRTFERPEDGVDGILFRADNHFQPVENTHDAADQWVIAHDNGKHCDQWRPSIFMRRWMSRLTLEITEVRVERVQDISEADILAEGVTVDHAAKMTGIPWSDLPTLHHAWAAVWDHINWQKASYKSNPIAWALTFRHVESAEAKEAD
jgi:hypothetical protein